MKILRDTGLTVIAGCYSPCQQGSSGGNRMAKDNLQGFVIAGCHSPCQQGSSGGNIVAKRKAG